MLKTIEYQKEQAFRTLITLNVIDNDATVAGGAPRNWNEGNLAADVDIYLRAIDGGYNKERGLSNLLKSDVREKSPNRDEKYYGMEGMLNVYETEFNGIKYDIIYIIPDFSPIYIMNHFQDSISQISWCPLGTSWESQINTTGHYRKSRLNKVIKYSSNLRSDSKRIQKLMKYYPTYKFTADLPRYVQDDGIPF